MKDEEWMALRVRYLMHNNIYLPDDQRPLYDAAVDAPEAQSGSAYSSAASVPPTPLKAPGEARSPQTEAITKPQLDLSEFIGGSR